MPSAKKPPAVKRKKVTASARARTSPRNSRKAKTVDLEGSYLQPLANVSTQPSTSQMPGPSSNASTNDAIFDMLQKLHESNKTLAQRLERVEQRSFTSTPVNQRSNSHELTVEQQLSPRRANHVGSQATQAPSFLASVDAQGLQHQQTDSAPVSRIRFAHSQNERRNAVLPTVDTLRRIPSVADAVNDVLASYESQARLDSFQGKNIKRSGRYNSVETINTPPHLRWPNEGYNGNSGKKRILYDELTMAQWVTGQLTNVYHISDPNLAKQALLQVIQSMKDATSLPWGAVRSAWASSMHSVEEGHLGWGDTTQWAINRLSSSQIAMASSQASQPQQSMRVCKYFNDGKCTHESHHGQYLHFCGFCHRQGKSAGHPEVRCNSKTKGSNRQNSNNNN